MEEQISVQKFPRAHHYVSESPEVNPRIYLSVYGNKEFKSLTNNKGKPSKLNHLGKKRWGGSKKNKTSTDNSAFVP